MRSKCFCELIINQTGVYVAQVNTGALTLLQANREAYGLRVQVNWVTGVYIHLGKPKSEAGEIGIQVNLRGKTN